MAAFIAFVKQYRNGIVIFLLLMAAVVLLFSVRLQADGLRGLRASVIELMGPVQNVLMLPAQVIARMQGRIVDLARLDTENRWMRKELLRLQGQEIQLEEMRQENKRLRELLYMEQEPGHVTQVARIVGDSSPSFSHAFLLNAGTLRGVREEASAISPHGLVGRVVQVTSHNSMVLALTDLNSRVPAMAQRSRIRGIVSGSNDEVLQLRYVPKDADVQVDDVILTSGIDGIFPKGLLIGKVMLVDSDEPGLFQRILIKPAVNFHRLEEVRLLLPVAAPPAPPPAPPAAAPATPPGRNRTP
ncbi:MAG: rod shape-determining protein MreC [Magnetococcales bacterium]|nr:rod shape-determining protein MreC [Magnetococcales bacterium]